MGNGEIAFFPHLPLNRRDALHAGIDRLIFKAMAIAIHSDAAMSGERQLAEIWSHVTAR